MGMPGYLELMIIAAIVCGMATGIYLLVRTGSRN